MVVEDDDKLRELIAAELGRWDFEVVAAGDFSRVDEEIALRKPHLVLMDLGLPAFDGHHWCSRVRAFSLAPILIVSARDSSADQVMGMGMGADDYLVKPFAPEVLVAKVKALLRRSYDYDRESSDRLTRGELELDLGSCVARRGDSAEVLTRNEFLILRRLMESPGAVVGRDALATALWRDEVFVDDNTLTVNVNRLRGKLAGLGLADAIRTVKGMGYLLE